MGVKRYGRRSGIGGYLLFIIFAVFISYKFITGFIEQSVKAPVSYPRTEISQSNFVSPVIDNANILSSSEKHDLNHFLTVLNNKTGIQIAVVTVPSLGDTDIETFSLALAEKLKLGQKGVDNGALLTVAMAEHEVRIETGYGTEGSLTDAKCARIIRNIIAPAFRKGDYGKGINEAVRTMAGIISDDESLVSPLMKKQQDSHRQEQSEGGILSLIFTLIVFFIIMRSRWGWLFLMQGFGGSHHHHGGHSGGFGGGGFSGGGGSFGGGGASGKW